jgi:phosphoadenosine phosphosulfate reductase
MRCSMLHPVSATSRVDATVALLRAAVAQFGRVVHASSLERLERHYQRRLPLYYPQSQAIGRYVREHGINGFYNGLNARLRCCEIRKIEPFRRAIAGYRAWVTGVRREQEVWNYIRAEQLPYNPLHDRGFSSIGCAPCSRAIEPGESQRAGRWWWEQSDSRECGLQPRIRSAAAT